MWTVSFPPMESPGPSPSVIDADVPSKSDSPMTSSSESNNPYHLTLLPTIGIVVTAVSLTMLVVLVILIRRKNRELDESESLDRKSAKTRPSPRPVFKIHQEFNTVIGHGGFGTVYKAEFSDGLVAAVKRMNKASEQSKQDFCREIELLAKLHHRNLVDLKGFCIEKKERFLIYEYMENGSLKDHLHSTEKPPLSWETRMKIAIDVANALEYLHFYCDPPLCHRDIKSSNILLDDKFVAKLSDFGLAHSSRDGSVCFEPVNTDIHGTPGYVDPEYVVTQELTEKSDVYSYGVVLLEIITGRRAVDEGRNLVETSQRFLVTKSRHKDLVDPRIKDSIDDDDNGERQLEAVVTVVRMCTEKEGRSRPSIKQVLRMLCESYDPLHSGFARQESSLRGKALASERAGSGTQRTSRQQTVAAKKAKEQEKRAGKSIAVATDEESGDESADEQAPTKRDKMSKGKEVVDDRDRAKTPSEEELYHHLLNGVTWTPTRFADLDLLKEVGLDSDIEAMLGQPEDAQTPHHGLPCLPGCLLSVLVFP
ncbi:hypothetical protein DY000_02059052 [Brassica cretica]|uniref:Protein kinase domain-containing protein n=1 Tax=Brassica cretica TaxID=69181 RepID=A0ABQ7B1C6_BRACR|nr:hypothetical protein DY000_02059052 [Brassica cretica]